MDSKVYSGNGTAAETPETELSATAAVETEWTVEAEVAPKKEAEPVADHPMVTELVPATETSITEKVHSPMTSKVHSVNGRAAETPESEIPVTVKPVADRPTVTELAPSVETTVPNKKWRSWPGDCLFRVIVPVHTVESIFGRNGDLIKKMCQETKAHIRVLEGPVCHPDRIVEISGKEDIKAPLSPAMDAVIRLFKLVNGFPENESDGVASIPFCSIRLLVPSMQATSLIMSQGSLIKKIQENIGCSVRILSSDEVSTLSANSDDRVVNLKGEGLKVRQALEAVLGHLCMFLVDHTILPLSEKTHNATTTQEKGQVVTWDEKSIIHSDTQPQTRRKFLFLDCEPQQESQFSSSGLSYFGHDMGSFTKCPGFDRSAGPSFNKAKPGSGGAFFGPVKDQAGMAVLNKTTAQPPNRRLRSTSPPPHVAASAIATTSGMESIEEPKRSRVSWENISVVKMFHDACIHEITINGWEDGSLKAMSWKKVGEMLQASHNFPVDSKQMKNYFDGLKSKYRAWVSLKNKTGNKYDPSTNTFHLTDKEWEIEIKENFYIETLRNASLPFPYLCAQLFDGAISLGPSFAENIQETEIQKDTMSPVSSSTSNPPPPPKNKQITGKRLMSVFEEEMLGVLKMISHNINNKPEPPPKPTFEDCEKKLNELRWPKADPLHLIALTIFCDENDNYRKCWMKLNPERCANWVRVIGRSKRFT